MKKIDLLTEGVRFKIKTAQSCDSTDFMEIDRSQSTPNEVSLFVRNHYIKDDNLITGPIWTSQFAFWIGTISKTKIHISRDIAGARMKGFIKLSDIIIL